MSPSPVIPEGGSLPEVAVPPQRTPLVLFGLGLAGVAIALFVGLESARTARQPAREIPTDGSGESLIRTAPTADLYIPPATLPGAAPSGPAGRAGNIPVLLPPATYHASPVPPVRNSSPTRLEQPFPSAAYGAPWVPPPPPLPEPAPAARQDVFTRGPDRVQAGRIRNTGATVVQGTMISAVLESALDSTRPGQARALVTRDVKGFDGSRTLIPRGSRLFGDYDSDVSAGQNRMMIRWSRMILPDGISVALDSPAADPLGRAGVRASVDSHLLTRLENALIDGSASLSANLLSRRLGSGNQVVVAFPGAVQSGTTNAPQAIAPTLKVKQGARISVFVAHDLDFSSEQ